MFDPLSSSTAASWGDDQEPPPWPTTPHSPNSSIPNLRRAVSPVPPTPDKGPSPGLYGKEPQIYGQPETGLISPRETTGSNGVKFEKAEPYLRVRINGLDRNRRDILVKLDAQVGQQSYFGVFIWLILWTCCAILDQSFQLQRNNVSQCVTLVFGVPAVLRLYRTQQPTDYYTCSAPRPDLCPNR